METPMTRTPRKKTPRGKTPEKEYEGNTPRTEDTVEVYCRIMPLRNVRDEACLQVVSPNVVRLLPPGGFHIRPGPVRDNFTFMKIFNDFHSQKEIFNSVALPLVRNLLQGKNSLLLTCGAVGSGKTYTMHGSLKDGGILPRCVDVIFNTIAGHQAEKYVLKPDKMNWFEVQTLSEAKADCERPPTLHHAYRPLSKLQKRKEVNTNVARVADPSKMDIELGYVYSVFVTNVQIYNNFIYDVLDNSDDVTRSMQNRVIRGDGKHNMYIHGVTEKEVQTADEALEMFSRAGRSGQAQAALKPGCNSPHTVFTLRLVQAPAGGGAGDALCDSRSLRVSQLSLVELAAGERTSRSSASGRRLRCAGGVNNSLFTLRTCLEVLRENQTHGTNRIVPYRESRMTLLFKNFFEGDGLVHVVACVSSEAENFDDTVHTMKFAELNHESQPKPCPAKYQVEAHQEKKAANELRVVARYDAGTSLEVAVPAVDVGIVTSLGRPCPPAELGEFNAPGVISQVARYLGSRMKRREVLGNHVRSLGEHFRARLADVTEEMKTAEDDQKQLEAELSSERQKTADLEHRFLELQDQKEMLTRNYVEKDKLIKDLEMQIREKDWQIAQRKSAKYNMVESYKKMYALEKEKLQREVSARLEAQRKDLLKQTHDKIVTLKQMRDIIGNDNLSREIMALEAASDNTDATTVGASSSLSWDPASAQGCRSDSGGGGDRGPSSDGLASGSGVGSTTGAGGGDGAGSSKDGGGGGGGGGGGEAEGGGKIRINIREARGRARQLGRAAPRQHPYRPPVVPAGSVWVEHRSGMPAAPRTVLQPVLQRRRSRTLAYLTKPADLVDPKVSNYCLMTQEEGSQGSLETRIYKADVVPTSCGGAQVIFNDVEALKQRPPVGSPPRRRLAARLAGKNPN